MSNEIVVLLILILINITRKNYKYTSTCTGNA